MSSSKRGSATSTNAANAVQVTFENDCLNVALDDGRTIAVPLEWFPVLRDATEAQRNKWELVGGGIGIHWSDLDEDLSVSGLLNSASHANRVAIPASPSMAKVWIIGAGFSKALGGPLLSTLFSYRSVHRILHRYPKDSYAAMHDDQVLQAHWLYHWGRDFEAGPYPDKIFGKIAKSFKQGDGLRLWEDPEEYLEYLGFAAEDEAGDSAALLRESSPHLSPFKMLHKAGRRLLAAECMLFTENASIDSERWKPYVHWVENVLESGDTVVSFNYDPVLEKLADNPRSPNKIWVPLPKHCGNVKDGAATVLKLHGSTNWQLLDEQACENESVDFRTDTAVEPCIGMPGPNKFELTQTALQETWKAADKAIRSTRQIYLLGYRFPPTDSQARIEMFKAIGDTSAGSREVTIVLGPPSVDTMRVRSMVEHVCGGKGAVQTIPMGVEDFFSVIPSRSAMKFKANKI